MFSSLAQQQDLRRGALGGGKGRILGGEGERRASKNSVLLHLNTYLSQTHGKKEWSQGTSLLRTKQNMLEGGLTWLISMDLITAKEMYSKFGMAIKVIKNVKKWDRVLDIVLLNKEKKDENWMNNFTKIQFFWTQSILIWTSEQCIKKSQTFSFPMRVWSHDWHSFITI